MVDLVLSLLVFALAAIAVASVAYRPHLVLYALAAVVSIVGINVHVGITFYLSRIVIICFLVTLALRPSVGKQLALPSRPLLSFIFLFGLILLFQLVSVLFSDRVLDGIRQVSIYLSAMTIFVLVVIVGNRLVTITNAVRIYLLSGLIQGLYGLYQLIGFGFGWPTYQSLLAGIPMYTGELLVDGYLFSPSLGVFRASGFFPSDVSHYAGYMVGILLIGIALIVYDRRVVWPYLVILLGGIGLIFSFSRSGLLAFLAFGLPTLAFLMSRINRTGKRLGRSFAATLVAAPLLLLVVVLGALSSTLDVEWPNVGEVISNRLADVVNPEQGDDSMSEHILTRLTGLDAFASSPLIGVGLGVNATMWYSENFHRYWGGSHSHHLDILGQTGIIGGGLQFLFMALVATYMWRGLFASRGRSLERHLLAGLLAAYVAILLGNFLYHYFMVEFVWFLMGIGVALSRLLILDARKKGGNPALDMAQNGHAVHVSLSQTEALPR